MIKITSAPILTRNNFRKLEAWAMSLALGFFLFALLIEARQDHVYKPWAFNEYGIQYNYLQNFFLPALAEAIVAYAALMVLVLLVEPYWEREKSFIKTAACILGIALFVALCFSVADTYLDAYKLGKYTNLKHAYNRIFFDAFVKVAIATLVYIAYYLVKVMIGTFINNLKISKPNFNGTVYKIGACIFLWLMVLAFLAGVRAPIEMALIWAVIVPYSTFIICLNIYWLIPNAPVKKFYNSYYLIRLIFVVVSLDIIAAVLFSGMHGYHNGDAFVIFILILLWTAIALVPWSWYLYKNITDKTVLVTALGRSDASLSFLKSQINPHFLFNALNTLYGTALQEKAERTGEGIQKLGDMMRFMLQENVQDKISLARDVDYLNNYIDLQKLRTSRTADIIIETKIDEQLNNLEISPMLLIPFVENAFKHGISLQEPSHIKITLQTKENILYFDVHNSIHIKADNDPEKLKSGIGLSNVKQRLALLYPNKYELIIRESAKEFFIHLTLTLD